MLLVLACSGQERQPAASSAMIRVAAPEPGAVVTSPLVVRGEARGPWYFEADFPVRLVDSSGVELAVQPARAQGDWMTPEFVPFEAVLEFRTPPRGGPATLILEKANPSGLPEHADALRIPVRLR